MILACICKHDFQDKQYGTRNRVHNRIPKQQGADVWRCTICLNEKAGKERLSEDKAKKR